ncbi:MAG: hypothetical protein O2954_16680, partial [bacterium]|nr:hypothetical protein [bacterium]
MSHISWGTIRKVLCEAQVALGSTNLSGKKQQALAAQKLEKATGYINTVDRVTTGAPRRFAEKDVERLQLLARCLKEKKLAGLKKKGNLAAYLEEGGR